MIIRELEERDLKTRVDWMNDERVNATLNIRLPVSLESTHCWFRRIKEDCTRVDFAFERDGKVVAMGGFTNIVSDVGKAELYIFVNPNEQGKGVGTEAVKLMCQYGFDKIKLNKIYLYTNADNLPARRLYEKLSFALEGYMPREVINNGKIKDRCYYGLYQWTEEVILPLPDVLNFLGFDTLQRDSSFFLCQEVCIDGQRLKVVRDDIFPFIGGGNKARKAMLYERYLKANGYNAVVTTGGIQSNHNRAVALMAAYNGWKCHLVYHGKEERFCSEKGNALLARLSGATMEFVDASGISSAMDSAIDRFKQEGLKPYYITGGGHDLPGGIAFVNAVRQLYEYGLKNRYKPACIVHASGTGSTQAGIMVGLDLVDWSDVKVIGISVARQQERGRQVIADFATQLGAYYGLKKDYTESVIFNTDYLCGGYENFTPEIQSYLEKVMRKTGLIFDTTYSGKAFYGMMDMLHKRLLEDNVLFWHTGGLMNVQK